MGIAQDIADGIIKVSVDLNRVEIGMQVQAVKLMEELEKELVALVAQYDPSSLTRTAAQQKRLVKMLDDARSIIKDSYSNLSKTSLKDSAKAANAINKEVVSIINESSGISLISYNASLQEIRQIAKGTLIHGAKSAEWWSRQAGDLQFKFEVQMREAMTNGESIGDMVRRIRGTWDKDKRMFVGGIMRASTANAAALARTSVINIANQSRIDLYRENSDVVGGMEWLSVLDSRTSTICKALDGLRWDLDYKPIGHSKNWPGATAHWSCRSSQVPFIKGLDDLPETTQKKISKNKRAQSGFKQGPVSINTKYEDWFTKQPKADQKEILGPTKYKMWNDGKLSIADLTDVTNRPLTVDELIAKYGNAA